MSEEREPYLGLVGRAGPLFDGVRNRLPRLGPRRAIVETEAMRGLDAAIVELGGLPDDEGDLPPPPQAIRRSRSRLEEVPRLRVPAEPGPDVGVVESPARPPGRARVPGVTQVGPVEQLARQCSMVPADQPTLRYVWEPRRRWRFDLAWPRWRIGVLIDGGCRVGGRIVYGGGWIRDSQQLNAAAIEGWMVLRVTAAQVEDGSALRLIARALSSSWKRV